MGVLDRILAQKREEVTRLRGQRLPSPPALRKIDLTRPPGAPLRLIAEIKHRSPSAGALSTALTVAERARRYEAAGARMVSVLCDEVFFGGGFPHLSEAREACALPLLCKEFVIDEVQLDAARAFGADAVLLIVRCLSPERLATLVSEAKARGLTPFVEITNDAERELALGAAATVIGVNARDLDTLEMQPERARAVVSSLPGDVVKAHFSGLSKPEHVRAAAESPADAALIGEALMRADDPYPLLSSLVDAAGGR
jgi:indole-3-glycerol phosphate synthase